jgi:hypothetical protein
VEKAIEKHAGMSYRRILVEAGALRKEALEDE